MGLSPRAGNGGQAGRDRLSLAGRVIGSVSTVHVGRQTIFDVAGGLYGYELLFRDTSHAAGATQDGDDATSATILAAFSEFGVGQLLQGKRGFVNLSRRFVTGELPLPFGPGDAALEILETISLDRQVVTGVTRLAEQGYAIVLDDFTWEPAAVPLLEVADIVKIDVLAMTWDEVRRTADHCRPHGVRLLAEKVEDAEIMKRCELEGFELFQGYHLGRPETHSARTLSPSQVQAIELLGRLSDPEITAAKIEDAVSRDPALMYRLLRIANSASAGLSHRVSSVRETLVVVGLNRLRAWLVLLARGTAMGSEVLLTAALTRARTCEETATKIGTVRPDVAFTLGLLDGLAECLGVSTADLHSLLPPLAPDLSAALTGGRGRMRSLLDAVLAYERADEAAMAACGIPLAVLSASYIDALAWTAELTQEIDDVEQPSI